MIWRLVSRVTAWVTEQPVDMIKCLRPSTGLAALNVARSELGQGEQGGNNRGPALDRYRSPMGSGAMGGSGAWCAALMCYCLEQGAKAIGKQSPVKRTHGARRLFRRAVAAGVMVELKDIQPGDLVCWGRGPRGGWQAHIGIVSEVRRDGGWSYIAGNEGPYPALVAEHEGHTRRLIGFARV